MAELSEQEIREAADEAGLSPREVRLALRDAEPARVPAVRGGVSLMPPPSRGQTMHHVENALALPAKEALTTVRRALERELGQQGHQHGELEAAIVDERHGLTYRVQAEDDGRGGSLVRIDVDPAAARAKKLLFLSMVGAMGAMGGAFLLLFGFSLLFTIGVAGVAGLGLYGFFNATAGEKRGLARARHATAGALVAAEEAAVQRSLEDDMAPDAHEPAQHESS